MVDRNSIIWSSTIIFILRQAVIESDNISIQHPTSYTVLSNMPIQRIKKVDNKMQWTHFEMTPAISILIISDSFST